MDKVKRHVGILTAIALLALAFTPVKGSSTYSMAWPVTPLDSTVLSRLTVEQTAPMRIWIKATNARSQLASCMRPSGMEAATGNAAGLAERQRNCWGQPYAWHQVLTVGNDIGDGADRLVAYEPAIDVLLAEYVQVARATARQRELDDQIGASLSKYLEVQRPRLASIIWTLHLLLVAVAMLMVIWRARVGTIVLLPLTALLSASHQAARRNEQNGP
jgi:hypothetical protein